MKGRGGKAALRQRRVSPPSKRRGRIVFRKKGEGKESSKGGEERGISFRSLEGKDNNSSDDKRKRGQGPISISRGGRGKIQQMQRKERE